MHRPSETVLEAFREALHPAAFAHPFSGTSATVVDDPRPSTRAGFAAWAAHHVARLRDERWPEGGRPERVVLVEDGQHVLRRWDDAPCCEPAWLADRVRPEAAPLLDPWVLGVSVAPPLPSWEGRDADTGEWEEFAEPRWLDTTGTVAWYAESRRPGVARVLAGVQHLELDPRTGEEQVLHEDTVGPRRDEVARAFRRVLARHPARSAHRLR